jgi:hypothetical protein
VITGFGIVVGFVGLIVVVTIGSMRLLTWACDRSSTAPQFLARGSLL